MVQPLTWLAISVPVGWARPRSTTRWMDWMSIAWYSALRTRRSFSGFLPFTSEPGSSSRNWSRPRKMVRYSGPSSTCRVGVCLMRAKSCRLGSITKSISPDSSAAVRVASALMGV
ncbi:hypothetical protein D3C72_1492100 [compost metagenome]